MYLINARVRKKSRLASFRYKIAIITILTLFVLIVMPNRVYHLQGLRFLDANRGDICYPCIDQSVY